MPDEQVKDSEHDMAPGGSDADGASDIEEQELLAQATKIVDER